MLNREYLQSMILLTLYITNDEFLIQKRSYFINIIILQDNYLFIYFYTYMGKLFIYTLK
jgi:hypothetical protein